MDANTFYQTVAGFSFTLVGLWWAVVQFRHEEWMHHPAWRAAADFLAEAESSFAAAQGAMARLTGNYKRGNERAARQHPRNRR